eukprot:2158396-Pyramimonas_sp.AAC.1
MRLAGGRSREGSGDARIPSFALRCEASLRPGPRAPARSMAPAMKARRQTAALKGNARCRGPSSPLLATHGQ